MAKKTDETAPMETSPAAAPSPEPNPAGVRVLALEYTLLPPHAGGRQTVAGDEYTLPADVAQNLIDRGLAKRVGGEPADKE